MDFQNSSVKFSDIKHNAYLAEMYSKIYSIPRKERIKVLMSWLANAYSDLLIPFLPEAEVLATFISHIKLLDTFANNSSYDVVAQLASEFSENCLLSQVIPDFLERNDKVADVTYYIEVICENLTCPSLIRKLMDIVTSRLTTILVGRIRSENHSVAAATLNLLKALLELYCEDLWYDLILQYLLPMKHLINFQRQKMLPEIEFYESTNKLMDLIPKCVGDAITAPLLAEHFMLYFQDELARLRSIDSAVASALPSSKSDLQKVGLSLEDDEFSSTEPFVKKTGNNPTYPMWIFRYDGTDFLHALRRGYLQEPEEYFEDGLFSSAGQLNTSPTFEHDGNDSDNFRGLSRSQLSNDENFYDLSALSIVEELDSNGNLQPTEISARRLSLSGSFEKHEIHSRMLSRARDKRESVDSLGNNSGAYLGPFLHALYEILSNWTNLNPDVLFTATEVISVLASSRIPLINTLFLDMSLILQPSYPSFSTLIHSIKNDLEEYMRKYPDYVLRNVWKFASKDCPTADAELGTGMNDAANEPSFVDTLKRTIRDNKTFRMAAEVQRTMKVGRSGSFTAFSNIFKTQKASSRASEFRLLNRTSSPFQNEEDERDAKIMALRCVLFSHWMLELGAIAMHLCWGRRAFHGNQQMNAQNGNGEEVNSLATVDQRVTD